jgi:Yip1-like protein
VNLPHRIAGLFTDPRAEWQIIAAERDDVGSIARNYVAVLALVPAACLLAGVGLMGGRFLGVAGIMTAVMGTTVGWVVALFSSIAAAAVIEKLAPVFKSDGDMAHAMKLVAYAATPVWLAGVFFLLAALSPLAVGGVLWAIYLLYLGLPVVMKTPQAQVVPFMLVSILVIVVANVVLREIFAAFRIPYMGYY